MNGRDMKNTTIFGFLLKEDTLYEIDKKRIILCRLGKADSPLTVKVVSLNDTQSRLLSYLLMNRKRSYLDKEEIMRCVWDNENYSSSNQRLWQTMNDVRKKLSYIGMPETFIKNIYGNGYRIDDSIIMPLFKGY
ncbi:helix-turn-helix domain-containing protein [Enterobacter bugandensis]|nr:helix-turn-helix domain-containing protein [Enterobacter bugandensis]